MEVTKFSFDEIDMLARTISKRIKKGKFTHVAGIARGGLVPATIISYELELPLITFTVSSYKDCHTKIKPVGSIASLFDLPVNSRLLIVDDICDSGETMNWLQQQLAVTDIKYEAACIFIKKQHKNKIKFYGSIVPDDKWVVFPWE